MEIPCYYKSVFCQSFIANIFLLVFNKRRVLSIDENTITDKSYTDTEATERVQICAMTITKRNDAMFKYQLYSVGR